MEHEKCYVYDDLQQVPPKRRRIESEGLDSSAALRKQTYRKLWTLQQARIHDVIHNANLELLDRIDDFVISESAQLSSKRLPTGFIITEPGNAASGALFEQISTRVSAHASHVFVNLKSADCPNLKTALKNLIKKVTSVQHDEEDEDELVSRSNKGPRLLNYDLQLVFEWFLAHDITKLVITFQDSEAIATDVLTETLKLLSSWSDRLPTILLFGVATSIDLFQQRLPQAAIRCMQGVRFDATSQAEVLERVFESVTSDRQMTLRIGPALSDMLLQRHKDHLQSMGTFIDAIKYAFMSHFYANALSVFLCENLRFKDLTKEHFEAIRNLTSFRTYAESLLQNNDTKRLPDLLEINKDLFAFVEEVRQSTQVTQAWLVGAIRVFSLVFSTTTTRPAIPFSELYVKALSGRVASAGSIKELLLFVKKASSDKLIKMVGPVADILMTMPPGEAEVSPDDFRDIEEELAVLLNNNDASKGPLRSEDDIGHEQLQTTIIAQKVGISKRKIKLSKHETAYSELVGRFHDLLESYFETVLVPMEKFPLHEIFFYNLKSPHRDVFMPKPRFAIERALSAPHDYLGCSCCATSQDGLSASQPPTAILYQLYLESGALINAHDLWSAFNAILGDQHEDEQMTMALFYRGLAELKHMGYIKPSRRKVDHLVKLAWKGL